MKVVVAYIPVLHEGYRRFIENNARDSNLYLICREFFRDFRPIEKDIRALDINLIKTAIESWGIARQVSILSTQKAEELASSGSVIILPDEDISRMVVDQFFRKSHVAYDSVFLRWDTRNTVLANQVSTSSEVKGAEFEMLQRAIKAAEGSSDWWRRVGAVAVRDGVIIATECNRHLPSPQTPYVDGDPRANFFKGVHIDLSTAIHAEAAVIANAARRGVSLEGTDMFVTTFPCPPCAKLIAESGIRRVFFIGDYSMLDGERVLVHAGVELIRVNVENPPTA